MTPNPSHSPALNSPSVSPSVSLSPSSGGGAGTSFGGISLMRGGGGTKDALSVAVAEINVSHVLYTFIFRIFFQTIMDQLALNFFQVCFFMV